MNPTNDSSHIATYFQNENVSSKGHTDTKNILVIPKKIQTSGGLSSYFFVAMESVSNIFHKFLGKWSFLPLIPSTEGIASERFWEHVKNELSSNNATTFITFEDQVTLPRKTVEAMLDLGVTIAPENIGKFVTRLNEENISLENFKEEGFSPLHLAAIAERRDLIDANSAICDPNILDKKGRTPLHLACFFGHKKAAERLLQAGAFQEFLSPVYGSPITLAKKSGERALAELLIRQIDRSKKTPTTDYCKFIGSTVIRDEDIQEIAILLNRAKYAVDNKDYVKIIQNSTCPKALEKYFKEEKVRRVLAHILKMEMESKDQKDAPLRMFWQKDGKMMMLTPRRGGFSTYFLKKMAKGTKNVSSAFAGDRLMNICSLDLLEETLSFASRQSQVEFVSSEVFKRYTDKKPLILAVGYRGHSVDILIWDTHFVICNRGEASRKPIEFFQFDPNLLTEDILWNLDKKEDAKKDYIKLLSKTWPKMFNLKQGYVEKKLEKLVNLPDQLVDNCTWESAETAVYAFLMLDILKKNDRLRSQAFDKDIATHLVAQSHQLFDAWLLFQQLEQIEKYLDKATKVEKTFFSNFDVYDELIEKYHAAKEKCTHPILLEKMLKLEEKYPLLKDNV